MAQYTLDFSMNRMAYDLMHHVKQNITDDTALSQRQVADWIRNNRVSFVQQSVMKGMYPTDDFKQSLGCVELEQVDWSECCDTDIGCTILRSKQQIPTPVFDGYSALLTRVATVGVGKRNITITSQERAISSGYGRFNKQFLFAFLKNNYLYVISQESPYQAVLKYITVEGVFDTPEQAARFNYCDGTPCYTENSRYPISRAAFEWMKRRIVQADFAIQAKATSDKTNNATDDTEQEV